MARSNQLASLAVDIVINARRFRSVLRQTKSDLKGTQKQAQGLVGSITKIGLAASAFLILQRGARLAMDAIIQTTLAMVELESQLISIEKITGGKFGKQFFELGREISNISFQEIAAVSAAAARSGLRDPKEIKEFSKAVLILSKTSDDIEAQEASLGLARLIQNFKLGTDQALQLANNIDVLSDNFTITSGAILKSSQILSGFAVSAELTVDELNALIATLLSTGATATTVRTTLGVIFKKVIPNALEAGKIMGLVGDELVDFATVVSSKGVKALQRFISEFAKLGQLKQQEVLEKLGIAGARVQLVIDAMVISQKRQTEALKLSADSINNTDKILLKFNTTVETAATKLEKLKKEHLELLAAFGTIAPFEETQRILRGFGIIFGVGGVETKKTLKNLKDVRAKIKKIKSELGERRIVGGGATLREQKFFAEVIKKQGIVGNIFGTILQASVFGNVADLIDQLKSLEETEKAILDARKQAEAATGPEAKAKAAANLIEKENKAREIAFNIREARAFKIREILQDLPSAKTGLAAKLENLEKQRIKFTQRLFDEGLAGDDPRVVASNLRFFELESVLIVNTKAIKDEKEERIRLTASLKSQQMIIGGVGGKAGEAIQFLEQLDKFRAGLLAKVEAKELKVSDVLPAIKALIGFKEVGVKNILNPQIQQKQAQFKGLTQAWKDAVVSVSKQPTAFERKQKDFWRKALTVAAIIDKSARAIETAIKEQEEAKIGGR